MYSTKCTVHVRTVPKILGTVHIFGTFLFLRCTNRLTRIITWLPLTQFGSMLSDTLTVIKKAKTHATTSYRCTWGSLTTFQKKLIPRFKFRLSSRGMPTSVIVPSIESTNPLRASHASTCETAQVLGPQVPFHTSHATILCICTPQEFLTVSTCLLSEVKQKPGQAM